METAAFIVEFKPPHKGHIVLSSGGAQRRGGGRRKSKPFPYHGGSVGQFCPDGIAIETTESEMARQSGGDIGWTGTEWVKGTEVAE